MKVGYFDCFSGAAGDMILGALISAGLDPCRLRDDLGRLKLAGYELEIRNLNKQGIAATKVDVKLSGDPGHRGLQHITTLIDASDLSDEVKRKSKAIFTRLAEAEARVHGLPIEKIHFHEVGAVDAIVDVVGAVIGLQHLKLDRIFCSPISTGSGTIKCEHGVLPVPAPATAELLVGVPLAACEETGELITPTAAAILTTLAESFGPLPAMRIDRIGYGAGNREGVGRPNVLRLITGRLETQGDLHDEIVCLETNLDDTTGEQIGHAFERLITAGALDVFTTPILMKKNRPGVLLSVLVPVSKVAVCEDILFLETSTFGIRRQSVSRRKLQRRFETIDTPYGQIRIKLGLQNDNVIKAAAEYDDCAKAARESGQSLRTVMDAALLAWSEQMKNR